MGRAAAQGMLQEGKVAAEHTFDINVHHICVGFDSGRHGVGSDEGSFSVATSDTETLNAQA